MRLSTRAALTTAAFALLYPGGALAATSAGQPFPSDLYTQRDTTQITHLRVDLPKPDCTTHPSDCADISVLNTLDGFNIQPRISVRSPARSISRPSPARRSSSSGRITTSSASTRSSGSLRRTRCISRATSSSRRTSSTCSSSRTGVHDAAGQPLAPLVPSRPRLGRYEEPARRSTARCRRLRCPGPGGPRRRRRISASSRRRASTRPRRGSASSCTMAN